MIGKSCVELMLQTQNLRFNVKYLRHLSLINTLEVSSIIPISNLPSTEEIQLNESFVAVLSTNKDEDLTGFINDFKKRNKAAIKNTGTGVALLCDSPESGFGFVYVIILITDPLFSSFGISDSTFGVLKLSLGSWVNNQTESCLEVICQVRGVNFELNKELKRLENEKNKILKVIKHSKGAIKYFEYENDRRIQERKKLEKSVVRKFRKIEKIHEKSMETKDLYCSVCLNDFKNVLFLPCGHIEVCQNCLINNLKLEVGDITQDDKKCLNCEEHIQKALLVSFN